jgi:hypothetical protein
MHVIVSSRSAAVGHVRCHGLLSISPGLGEILRNLALSFQGACVQVGAVLAALVLLWYAGTLLAWVLCQRCWTCWTQPTAAAHGEQQHEPWDI